MTALRDAALEYQAKGFHVIPCHPKNKAPMFLWKQYQDIAPTTKDIERWWGNYPDANVALVLGRGLFAIDVDGPEGHLSLKNRAVHIGPGTPTSLTGKGVHYLFRGDQPDRVGLLPQVDVRGRGIIVVPPSIHPNGRQYTWLVPPDTIPEAPEALLSLLSQPNHDVVAPHAPSWLAEALAGVTEGTRNATCTRLAGYFLGKGMPQEAVEQLLLTWADKCSPRMDTYEVMQCVKSIAGREGPHDDEPKSLESGLLTVEQLYKQTPNLHTWIVGDYIPKGALVMLASEEKVGKSTFAYAMISAIKDNRSFMGRPVTNVPILMLAAEEHPTDVILRSQMFGIKPGDPVTYYVGDLPNDDMTLHDLTSIVKTRGIGLVVLDTMGHYISEALESENDSMGAIKALKPWLRLARATNAAVLVIHHTGKSGAAYRGSSGFGGIVDQILTLRHAGGRQRSLESRGRYWNTPRNLLISLENNDYRVLS
jgi:hypothetical protein